MVAVNPKTQRYWIIDWRVHEPAREKTRDYVAEYGRRAGVEGTTFQAVRSHAARRTPYFGQVKTHLAHLMVAAAMNIVRLLRWLANVPNARPRRSAFVKLYRAVA